MIFLFLVNLYIKLLLDSVVLFILFVLCKMIVCFLFKFLIVLVINFNFVGLKMFIIWYVKWYGLINGFIRFNIVGFLIIFLIGCIYFMIGYDLVVLMNIRFFLFNWLGVLLIVVVCMFIWFNKFVLFEFEVIFLLLCLMILILVFVIIKVIVVEMLKLFDLLLFVLYIYIVFL